MRSFLFFTLLVVQCATVIAQEAALTRDLQQDWLIYTGTQYEAYSNQASVSTIYIRIPANDGVGDYLCVKSTKSFSIFLNQQLLSTDNTYTELSIDSLRKAKGVSELFLTIFADKVSRNTLVTQRVHYPLISVLEVQHNRPTTFFRDFVLVASFTVLILLMVIIRLNPKLASDYFSVTKIFSLRESEDSIVYTRITSSGNFLFYGFSSLTIGFFLIMLFTYLPQKRLLPWSSFYELFSYWLALSVGITLIFLVKMLIIYLVATLFKLREVAGMQFFNWVRVLFLTVGFSVLLVVISILTRNEAEGWFYFFYSATGWLLILWIGLAFFKIAAKARIGLFHLFSYLCATEIIPSLIVLKILYY